MPSVKGLTVWCRRPVPTFAAILITALAASACQPRGLEKLASSSSSKNSARISIGTKAGSSGVSSSSISSVFPPGYLVPFSITQFDCFAVVVTSADIRSTPVCGGQAQMGLVSGFIPRGGKLEIDVPMGPRRIFQVWGFANSGSCPDATTLLITPKGGLPPGVASSGYLLGQRAADVVEKKMSLDITVAFTLGVSATICGPEVGKPVTTVVSAAHTPSTTVVANQGKSNVNEALCINYSSTATTPSFRCIQDGVEVACNAGACPVVAGASTHAFPASAGAHTFKVITSDTTTGLSDETPPIFTFTLDFVNPVLALTSISPGGFDGVNTFYTTSTTPRMVLTLDESGSVTRNVDAGGATNCANFSAAGSAACALGTLTVAAHSVDFIGTDTAGNTPATITRNVIVDQTAPTITTTPTATASNIWLMGGDLSNILGSPNSVQVATADPGGAINAATFLCSLDSAATTACASPLAFTGAGGKHTATVSVRDLAGNLTVSSFNAFIDTLTGRVVLGRLNHLLGSVADESSAVTMVNELPNTGGLSEPAQVAIDTSSNFVYVVDSSNNRVLAYNWDPISRTVIGHRAVGVFGQPNFFLNSASTTNTATYTPLRNPIGVALGTPTGGSKKLFIADTGNNRVLRFDISTGNENKLADAIFGQANSTTSGINFNSGTTSAVGGAIMQQGVNTPMGLYYHVTDDELYVADQENCRIAVWSSAGTTATSGDNLARHLGTGNQALTGAWPCSPGAADARTLNKPKGVTYDLVTDRLYVADTSHNRLLYWDTGNTATEATNASGVFGQTNFVLSAAGDTIAPPSLTAPAGVAVFSDGSNNRLVASTSYFPATISRVRFFDSTLASTSVVKDWNSFGAPSTTPSTFSRPTQLHADSTTGTLFVTDTSNNRILTFTTIGAPLPGDHVAHDVLGHVKYSDGSISFRAADASNVGDGTLESPSYIAADTSRGRLFVSDTDNNRVLVYQMDALNLKLASPLAFKSIGVPVLGSGNSMLDSLASGYPIGPDTLLAPQGLAYDTASGDLYVADTANNRVLRFNVNTASIADGLSATLVLGQADFTSNGTGATATTLDSPIGVAFDVAGNVLYVSDSSNNRIQVWQNARSLANGAAATGTIGALGTTAATLNSPRGLDITATFGAVNKGLWVADNGNNRVNYFDISGGAVPAAASACYGHHAASIAAGCAVAAADDGGTVLVNGSYAMNGAKGVHANAAEQRLYVTDSSNGRVLVYDLSLAANQPASGAVFSTTHAATHVIGARDLTLTALGIASAVGIPAGLKIPRGIISLSPTTGPHQLYIVDPGYHRVGNYEVP